MKFRKVLAAAAISSAVIFSVSRCEKPTFPYLFLLHGADTLYNASDSIVLRSCLADSAQVIIDCNVDWWQEGSCQWAEMDPKIGSGADTVTIRFEENPDESARSAKIAVKSEILRREFVIYQPGIRTDSQD